MIPYDEIQISPDLSENIDEFIRRVQAFRSEGPLDSVSVAKLEEHFKASHVYHSTGIEGNRLTLQETLVVLKDGLDISGKPLKDSLEAKSLGKAFDYLKELCDSNQPIRETDVRSLHSILLGFETEASPGEYRSVGVVIAGSEHKPPEPIAVPALMKSLVEWINVNQDKNPIILATIAHHELVAIHPFKDGNGRISRLLLNLIVLRYGLPICNIRREDRPEYYDALSFADVGLYEPLIKLVLARCVDLFSEYTRVREETKRMEEWAQRWGDKAAEVLRQREARELELWHSRVRQVFLEFQKGTELINEQLQHIDLTFYDFKTDVDFEKYQQLLRAGQIEFGNAFSITFYDKRGHRDYRFMFRYYRNFAKFPYPSRVIPLELNFKQENVYRRLSDLDWMDGIRIRELYFSTQGEFIIRYYDHASRQEHDMKGKPISEAVQWFFDDILKVVFSLG